MKRKASDFEEQDRSIDWSPNYSPARSSEASWSSPESVQHAHTDTNTMSRTRFNIHPIPYMNTRTRKRLRDGRPAEETIHQNTIAKLFNAQRQMRTDESSHDQTMNIDNDDEQQNNCEYQNGINLDGPVEKNQRSIETFFGGGAGGGRTMVRTPQYNFSAMMTMQRSPVSLCEDCSARLPTSIVDHTMDGYECVSCSRKVCDTCAVRGDARVCLECAAPGGGGEMYM